MFTKQRFQFLLATGLLITTTAPAIAIETNGVRVLHLGLL